ncbi:hypothetical protein F5Y03DRAFT_403016 [Xylaria venustula]|nr:hypothetical protein F5Y03DRAFT_403016 [Xylaria venustula]
MALPRRWFAAPWQSLLNYLKGQYSRFASPRVDLPAKQTTLYHQQPADIMDCRASFKAKRPIVSKNGLQTLREALRSDFILVSIDFENTTNIRSGFTSGKDCQVGLATLDTRDLQQNDSLLEDLIATYNFITGSADYTSRVSQNTKFGKSSVIDPSGIVKKIQSVIPQGRHVVLLGFAVHNELDILRRLGFDFSAFISTPTSSAIVDVHLIALEVLKPWKGGLRDLLRHIGCPYDCLHYGGNDANFTLKASLFLAMRNYKGMNPGISDYLRQISTFVLNTQRAQGAGKRKTKNKKKEKSRKGQVRARSIEKQNDIRAERAARRAVLEPLWCTEGLGDLEGSWDTCSAEGAEMEMLQIGMGIV